MRRNLLIVALIISAVCVFLQAQSSTSPKPPFTAADAARGQKLAELSLEVRKQIGTFAAPAEPFKIMGNLYFVGMANGESYLLTSPQGHILFGAGFESSEKDVEKNIETLGFKVTDIKAILLNHYHGDQSGGTAYLKQKSGAAVMAGFAEIPYMERPGGAPGGVNPPAAPPAPAGTLPPPQSPFAPYGSPQFQGIHNYPPFKVERALYDGDVIKVGPLTVTAYLAPGHSPSSTSWLYTVRDGSRDYRVFEFCCWEFPDDYSRSAFINEAAVRHTLDTLRKILPVDIYLETGSYGWSGILNQPSGTWAERMAKLKTNNQFWVNREIFAGLTAAREVDFEKKIRNLNSSN
jgi:glyoxylase-like metal-dependent hydrolase (beta-lactamase superfamily II)